MPWDKQVSSYTYKGRFSPNRKTALSSYTSHPQHPLLNDTVMSLVSCVIMDSNQQDIPCIFLEPGSVLSVLELPNSPCRFVPF